MNKGSVGTTDRLLLALAAIVLALVCASVGAATALTMINTSRAATTSLPTPPAVVVVAPTVTTELPASTSRTTTRTTSSAAEEGASEAEDDDLPSCGEIDPADYVDSNSCVNGNLDPATGTATGEDLAQEAIDADVPGDDIDPQRAYDLGDRPLTDAEVAEAGG